MFLVLLTVLVCGATGVLFGFSAVAREVSVNIVYSGNLDGELEPCGCTEEGNLGGIKRRATILDNARREQPGTIVLSTGGLISSDGSVDRLKSEYILKGFAQLGYDAIALQWRDLAYGVDFIKLTELPWVASNWQDSTFLHEKVISRSVQGRKIDFAFFSWLPPQDSPKKLMKGDHEEVSSDKEQLLQALLAAKQKNQTTVLATSLPLETVQQELPLAQVDILFIKSAYEVFGEPIKLDHTLVLQPGSRGMRVAKLSAQIGDDGQIKNFTHKVIAMPDSVPDAARLNQWYVEYNAKVKEDYLRRVELRKQTETGQSDFVGEEACQKCHSSQYKAWQNSKHAGAFDDLETVNKSFDPDCLQCHTVGFNKPGGFIDNNITMHLLGVQCESCHGAARVHVQSAGKQPVANVSWAKEQMCAQCHTQPHSPSFNVGKYWPKIAH